MPSPTPHHSSVKANQRPSARSLVSQAESDAEHDILNFGTGTPTHKRPNGVLASNMTLFPSAKALTAAQVLQESGQVKAPWFDQHLGCYDLCSLLSWLQASAVRVAQDGEAFLVRGVGGCYVPSQSAVLKLQVCDTAFGTSSAAGFCCNDPA